MSNQKVAKHEDSLVKVKKIFIYRHLNSYKQYKNFTR